MESKIEKTVVLTLNKKEAEWLKGKVQNPVLCEICGRDFKPEMIDEEDEKIRRDFWEALNDHF